MATFHLRVLGHFSASVGEKTLDTFSTDKIRALLAYLAIEAGRPHQRNQLATLFWGEREESAARNNLRKSLFRLRKTLGDEANTILTVTRSSVQFNASAGQADVTQFETLAQADDVAALSKAAELYQGSLLAGLALADAPTFDEWLIPRREQLHQQALSVLHRLTELHLAKRAYERARATAERQLSLEAWFEPAYRQLIRLHLAMGNRALAVAQYERCAAVLMKELGSEPSAETQALLDDAPPAGQLHHFPPIHTTFVGRESDVTRVITRLNHSETQLITLTGTGGIGKTRLATEAVRRAFASQPTKSTYFIALGGVATQAGVWHVLGEGLGIPAGTHGLTPTTILNHLKQHNPLLILDNYEQLMPDTTCIEQILHQAPDVQLIVTSRVPLNLRAEWRIPLDGLPLPDDSTASMADYAAVQLLLSAGQQMHPDLQVSANNQAHISKICHILAGMPLALEIAGSWLSLFTPQMLAEQLERNLNFLVSRHRDVSGRHRSLRAIFDHTIAQLKPIERQTLTRLSYFEESFSLPAGLTIANAPFQVFNTLLDHALLKRHSEGRFTMHPVLLTFVREDRQPDPDLQGRLAEYFLQQVATIPGDAAGETIESLASDTANIFATWRWACLQADSKLISLALDGLLAYCQFRGLFTHGQALFAEAANQLPPSLLVNRLHLAQTHCLEVTGDLATAVTLAQQVVESAFTETQLEAQIRLGRLYERTSQFDLGSDILNQALKVAKPHSESAAEAWNILGLIDRYQGRMNESLENHQRALDIYYRTENEPEIAESLANLGLTYGLTDVFDKAMTYLQEALSIVERLNHFEKICGFTYTLAVLHWRQDELTEAETYMEKSRSMAVKHNYKRILTISLNGLSIMHNRRFDYVKGLELAHEALQLADELGDTNLQAIMLSLVGNANRYLGNYAEAVPYVERSIEINRQNRTLSGLAISLGNMGETHVEQQQFAQAIPYFAEAIELLRQLDSSYYLCWALTAYALCLFSCGRFEEARNHNAEGKRVAKEVKREPYILFARLLEARLKAVDEDVNTGLTLLDDIERDYSEPLYAAELAYARWLIAQDPAGYAHAKQLAYERYEETKEIRYIKRFPEE